MREIIRTEFIDINILKGWEKVTKLYYNLAYKPPKQKILHLYYRFHKEYAEVKNKTHIALIEGRSYKKPCNKNLELALKPEGNYQHENKEMKTTKNIDHSNNTYKEMKKTRTIDHSNKPYSQEKLEVSQTPSPEGHSQQATKTSKSDIENRNTMIELGSLRSAAESFSDEIIMSPNPERNFPRVSISNEVSNYKVQAQNLSRKLCGKLEDNTEYLEKSAAFIGIIFHKFFEEAIRCSTQKQICETKTQEIAVEKSTKTEKPLATSPINFINEVTNAPMFHKMQGRRNGFQSGERSRMV